MGWSGAWGQEHQRCMGMGSAFSTIFIISMCASALGVERKALLPLADFLSACSSFETTNHAGVGGGACKSARIQNQDGHDQVVASCRIDEGADAGSQSGCVQGLSWGRVHAVAQPFSTHRLH